MSQKMLPPIWPKSTSVVSGTYAIQDRPLRGDKLRVVVSDLSLVEECPIRRVGLGPKLLEDFAAVTDAASLLNFTCSHGLLGYERFYMAHKVRWWGDPVVWAVAHARIVRGALVFLQIVNDVRKGSVQLDDRHVKSVADSLAQVVRQMGLEGPKKDPGDHAFIFTYSRPEALGLSELQSTIWIVNDWERNPVGGTYEVLISLINPMIKRMNYELRTQLRREPLSEQLVEGADLFWIGLRWHALIEAIYWELAARMAGEFRRCKRCQRVFPANGKRLFCSPSCKNKAECKKYRDSNRDELNKKRRRTKRRKR